MAPGQARRLLNDALATGGVSFSKHALDEMAADGLSVDDIYSVLKAGRIVRPEFENGSWRYRVSLAQDFAVLAFRSELAAVVVTAWRKRS